MTTQDKIIALTEQLAKLRAKEKRTGGSRAQTLEIDRVKWQIKCLTNKA